MCVCFISGLGDEVMGDVHAKVSKGPYEPTRAGIESHEVLQMPYLHLVQRLCAGKGSLESSCEW